ncbi:MAG: hypothetical protein N2D54_09015, partial [Chloroflexota bacterium]
PNSVKIKNNKIITIFQTKKGTKSVFWLKIRKRNGKYQLRAETKLDNNNTVRTTWKTVSNDAHLIEVEWKAAAGSQGYMKLYIDDVLKQTKPGLNNDTLTVRSANLGFINKLANAAVVGTYYIDDFLSSDSGYIGP